MLDTTRFSGRLKRKFRSLGSDGDTQKPVKLKRKTQTATKISSEMPEQNAECNAMFHFKNKCIAAKTLYRIC